MTVNITVAEGSTAIIGNGADDDGYLRKLEALLASQFSDMNIIPNTVSELEIILSILSEEDMRRFNMKYRGFDSATDVLSFPLWEENGKFTPPSDWGSLVLGDVIICPEAIAENAADANKTFIKELTLVVFHGVLHLVGFDHGDEEGEAIMWALQVGMVEKFFEVNADDG